MLHCSEINGCFFKFSQFMFQELIFIKVDMKWKSTIFLLQIHVMDLMMNDSSMYTFHFYLIWLIYLDIVVFNQIVNLPSQKTLSLVTYARHLQSKCNFLKPCPSTTNRKLTFIFEHKFYKQCENLVYFCKLWTMTEMFETTVISTT